MGAAGLVIPAPTVYGRRAAPGAVPDRLIAGIRLTTVAGAEAGIEALLIPGNGLSLRPWDTATLRQMAAWDERGFPDSAFDMGFLREPARMAEFLDWLVRDERHLHLAAFEADRAVGRVSVNMRDPAGIYIWGVHVPPGHGGRGVCTRMLEALLAWLDARDGGSELVLSVNSFAHHARRIYERLGFLPAETRWQFDPALDAALRRLAPAQRSQVDGHVRFQRGRWEVRTTLMRRPAPAHR